ncbi:hypothetical protein AVEN_271754-1, partial [Araneus ventricosus]
MHCQERHSVVDGPEEHGAFGNMKKNQKSTGEPWVGVGNKELQMAEHQTQSSGKVLKQHEGYFWDGPRNFEPRSDDEDDTCAATPSPNFHAINGRQFAHYGRFSVPQAPYMAYLYWNRVSNPEPFDPKAETLPQGHRGL